MSSNWRIGDANRPMPDDRLFSDESTAIDQAQGLADKDFERPIAVWDSQDDIAHLFFRGRQFRAV